MIAIIPYKLFSGSYTAFMTKNDAGREEKIPITWRKTWK